MALQKVVDRMSDSYLIINEDNRISDFNHTLLNVFGVTDNKLRNKDLFALIKEYKDLNINTKVLIKALENVKSSKTTVSINKHFDKINKYFHIEINSIESKGNFLGALILLKDVTQHNLDMQTIKNNQDMLIEKERLASLRTNDWWNCT
ncbi:MAG: PAS domain-containing protein [Clostridia bacterium]|nr:PAS domain-containing protein [Clostridia bacterium]